MATQKEVKNRITSVKNIRKITRAMEMVAAARLRRAEQRIDQMRPYAQAIRRITQQVAEAAGQAGNRVALLQQRDEVKRVGIILVTGDRGLAGSFNTQIIRAGTQLQRELEAEGKEVRYYVVGRRGNSALSFRGESVEGSFTGFTDQPSFANAREIGDRLAASLRRRGDRPGRADLQPLRLAADPVRPAAHAAAARRRPRSSARASPSRRSPRTPSSPRPISGPSGSTSRIPRRRCRRCSRST